MNFLLTATLPTELSMRTTNSFQTITWFLNMPSKYFDFNVYKQVSVNMAIRSGENYNSFLIEIKG